MGTCIHIRIFLLSAYLSVCGFNVQLPSKQVKYLREIETILFKWTCLSNRMPTNHKPKLVQYLTIYVNFATPKPRTVRIITKVMRNPPMIDRFFCTSSTVDVPSAWLPSPPPAAAHPSVSDSTKSLRFRILLAELG